MIRVLMVDDDRKTRLKVRAALEEKQFLLDEAEDGVEALKQLRRVDYDIIISEAMLLELDGYILCRQLRKFSDIPFVFLAARSGEMDKLRAFSVGADDYMTKPFYASELAARVQVLLERCNKMVKRSFLLAGDVMVNLDAREVTLDDMQLALSPREYALLVFLMENPHQAHSRETLLDEVWGRDFEGADRTVDAHIKSLRRHLGICKQYIQTVWGVGYRFDVVG